MAEEANDKLHIRLHVYNEEIEATIERCEEQHYRAAAKFITERYNAYAEIFGGKKSDHTIALMTLIDITLRLEKLKERNDTAPFNDILTQLTAEFEEALGKEK